MCNAACQAAYSQIKLRYFDGLATLAATSETMHALSRLPYETKKSYLEGVNCSVFQQSKTQTTTFQQLISREVYIVDDEM